MKMLHKEIEALTRHMERLLLLMRESEHHQQSKSCAAQGLHFHEYRVVVYLGQNGPSKMKDIGQNLSLSLSNLTAIVDKIELKGLAERNRSQRDRRIVMVHLSERGQAIFDSQRSVRISMSRKILKKLSPDERKRFVSLMQKITID
jgi:DNA-binding MarR family transcriptional regulator